MSVQEFKIVLLAGDGIGPEIIAEAVKILEVVQAARPVRFNVKPYLFGGCAVDAVGTGLPDDTLAACKTADAVLMGSIGGPKWGVSAPVRPEAGLLKLRKELNLFANIRPANFASESLLAYSPLRENVARGFDMIIVRELTGGIYFGERMEAAATGDDAFAWDKMEYSVEEIKRIVRVACKIAMQFNPPKDVHSIDKANVLATSRLWRKTAESVFKNEFPQLKFDHSFVDSAAMDLVAKPYKLSGVVVTENLFGDILSDESSVIPGSIGLLPSASLSGAPDQNSRAFGLYEPIHGSAPDIAGMGIANPIGTILSVAMMFRYSLGLGKEADAIEAAVRKVLDDVEIGGLGLRTADLGGNAKTTEVGQAIAEQVKKILVQN